MLPQIRTQKDGVNSITFRGSILYNAHNNDINTSHNASTLRNKIFQMKRKTVVVGHVGKMFCLSASFCRIGILVVISFLI